MKLQRGTQIAYVPSHAEGNINHPDVEFGFVTSVRPSILEPKVTLVFCRYWRKGELGVLRTTAGSESTPVDNIREHAAVQQSVVDELLKEMP